MNMIVLLSGGIDSTTCLSYYSKRGDNIKAVFFAYGQELVKQERMAARSIAKKYDIKLTEIEIENCNIPKGMIPGRNSFILSLALLEIDFESGGVAIGIHSGTEYADCSPIFVDYIQRIYDLYFDGRIVLLAPFIEWTKSEIIDYARTENVPLELTFSSNWEKADYLRK